MIDTAVPGRFPLEEVAVIDPEGVFSFRDLSKRIAAIQYSLSGKQGGRIAICLPNQFDFVAAFWGAALSGVTIVPLHVQMTEHEVIPLLIKVGATEVITTKQYGVLFDELVDSGLHVIYTEELTQSGLKPATVPREPDAPMLLLNTSGTTGNAKIVQLSQRNIETSVLGYLDRMNYGEERENNRILLATPLSSAYGIMILCACMLRGLTLVLIPDQFTLEAMYQAVEAHRVTYFEGGPLVLQLMNQMVGRPNPYDISSLKYMGFGGSKLSAEEIKSLEAAYPQMLFCQGYGMSEASPLVTKHSLSNYKKTDSAGVAIKGVELAVEADGALTAAPYIIGEIVIRGANVMLGYYDNKEETDKVIRNGCLYSGDVGYLDEEGYLYICGRIKNVIITRGFNVHPEEVEGCLLSSGFVTDCVVYGERNRLGDEIVCADIVPTLQGTVEEIRLYCAAHLAEYKRPAKIQLCDMVKRNAAGKTDRAGGAGK